MRKERERERERDRNRTGARSVRSAEGGKQTPANNNNNNDNCYTRKSKVYI